MADLIANGEAGSSVRAKLNAVAQSSRNILEFIPQNLWDDILSGSPTLDHTAAVANALASTSLPTTLTLPAGGVLNVDRFHIPAGCPVKTWIAHGCEIRQRSAWSAGLGHFVRFLRTADTYGQIDRVRWEGGKINQNDKYMKGHLFYAALASQMQIEQTEVVHRNAPTVSATLDTSTDVFTAVAHGFSNGDPVALFAGLVDATGALPSGTAYYVINKTADSFQLSASVGGAAINFSDTGTGGLFVCHLGSWAFCVGGRNIRMTRTRVSNGTAIYQDGHHIIHGNDIHLDNCHSASGDDAYAFGTEVGDFDNLSNVSVDSCYAYSTTATALKVYVNDPLRTVKGVHINGLYGYAGIKRNGAIFVQDNTGTDARTDAPKISNVRVRNADITVGSSAHDQTNPVFLLANGSRDVDVQLRGTADSFPVQEYLITKSNDVHLDLTVNPVNQAPGVVPGVISTSASFGTTNCTAKTATAVNYAKSPNMEGAVHLANLPTGWLSPPVTTNGVTRSVMLPGKMDGKQPLAIRLAGTSTGTNDFSICPSALTDIVAATGQVRRGKVKVALLAGSLANVTGVQLWLDERNSSGSFLNTTQVNITDKIFLGAGFKEFEVVRTLTDVSTTRVTLRVVISQAASGAVDITLGVLEPSVE